MTKILVLGTGPLLEEGATVMSGQCLRSWHFCAPLLEQGHQVKLLTVPIPGATKETSPGTKPQETGSYQGFQYTKLLANAQHLILPLIKEALEEFQPQALVGVNAYPAWLLASLKSDLPLWADLNGWTMAEGQIRAALLHHDNDYAHFWRLESQTLLVADRFSTVADRQADALYGELAMIGRLTHENFQGSLVNTVPNAVYPDYTALQRCPGKWPSIIQDQVPPNAHVCLWSGGFNSWTDLETLIQGVRLAMEQCPTLHLVCTGGAVHGHDEDTYADFLKAVETNLPKDRVHPLGWIDFPSVLDLHASATIGINIDGQNTETRFGARNRLTNMMGAGLPVLTTEGTEIAHWIQNQNLGGIFPQGSPQGLAELLINACTNPQEWEKRAEKARKAANFQFAAKATLSGFLSWIQNPSKAPDHQKTKNSPATQLQQLIWDQGQQNNPFSLPQQPQTECRACRFLRRLKHKVKNTLAGGNR